MYELLQQEAVYLNLEVEEKPLQPRTKGLYGDNVIWINKYIETTAEKACTLAEELGHYHTSVGHIIDQTSIENRKQENFAKRWAYKKMIPLESLIESYEEGCRSRYEIADLLNVTEKFLDETLNFYRERYGTEVKVNEHVLTLNPLTIWKGDYHETS